MNDASRYACNVLIVDDDADVLLAARVVLKKHFGTIVTEADPANLPRMLAETSFDVVLLDMNYTAGFTAGQEGIDWLKAVQRLSPDTKVILMTAYGAVETAVKGMREGAIDFVVKPWDNDKLVATVASAVRFSQAARAVRTLESKQRVLNEDIGRSPEIIGRSAPMAHILAEIDKVAPTDANVLIVGENGTGKELVARAIHRASRRADQTFVHVDLGAIPESLFEGELFGHAKGAFTDAKQDRPGRFEIAAAGTLFLDEIGNLSMPMQSKLLGALETRAVSRVGSNTPTPIDARIICATNVAPDDLRDKRQFRQDLLYRINTVEISVPPLRQRPDDIPLLVRHYVDKYARRYGKQGLSLSAGTLEKLSEYHWPGNVRELVHAVERAVIMSEDSSLSLAEFLVPSRREAAGEDGELNLEALEREAIRRAIAKHAGNMSKAAKELGLGRTTLYRKIARYGL